MQDYEGTILDGRDTSENRIKKKILALIEFAFYLEGERQ